MMKNFTAVIVMGCLGLTSVQAQETRWFGIIQAGVASYDTLQTGAGVFHGDTDDSEFAWGIGLGYMAHRNLDLRLGYERATGLDTVNRCRAGAVCPAIFIQEGVNINNWSLVAMPRAALGSHWSLYGTVGVQYLDISGGPLLPDDDGFDFLFGGGLEYQATPRVAIGGEIQASGADYLAGMLGLRFNF